MNDTFLRRLNPTETIINSLPAIIEAFVTFYGEPEREIITNKFKNILVIGYTQPNNISSTINQSNKEKSKILTDEFIDRLTQSEEEKEKLKKLFFDGYELEHITMHPLYRYMTYIDGTVKTDYNKQNVVNFLKQIHPETTIENLDELINVGTFHSIDIIVPIYRQIYEKYQEYKKEIKPYIDYYNGCINLKSSLEKKYIKKMIEELKNVYTETEYQQIQDRFNRGYFSSIRDINAKTKNYTGYYLGSKPLIEAFSTENDEILLHGKKWSQDSIKRDRIEYFKNFGLDLGDNYEAYINHPQAKSLIPSKELVERIINTNKEMYHQMMNEYYTSIPEYQKNRARIDELGLLDKEDGYDAGAYEAQATAITTNLKLIDGKYVEHPLLLMYMGSMEEYYDSSLIHELNHVYELCLQNIKEDYYTMTCGWDIVDGNINNHSNEEVSMHERREKRNYELFNEIINELIAQEISEILSQSGVYIFNTKENKKIKGGTSYESTMFIVREFYDTYKDVIIESRKNGNIHTLFEVVGKENVEALNQLFHEYHENFNGFIRLQVYEDLKNGVETEKTKKLKDIVERKNIIIAQMEEHSKKRKSSL